MDGLVPTNTHCENCQQELCSNQHVVKPANADLAAELRDELQFHRGRRQDEQIIAHECNRKLLQLGCPHPIRVTADDGGSRPGRPCAGPAITGRPAIGATHPEPGRTETFKKDQDV